VSRDNPSNAFVNLSCGHYLFTVNYMSMLLSFTGLSFCDRSMKGEEEIYL